MTIAQIEDEIRRLRPNERIELYRWLDYMVVADCAVDTSFCSRLGWTDHLDPPRNRLPKLRNHNQDPPSGSSVTQGFQVNLMISLGPQMLTVPKVERGWLEASGRAAAAVTATSLTMGTITQQK